MKATIKILLVVTFTLTLIQCKNANVKHEGFPSGKSDNYELGNNSNGNDSTSRISHIIKPARKVISDQMIPDNYKPGDSSALMQMLPKSTTATVQPVKGSPRKSRTKAEE